MEFEIEIVRISDLLDFVNADGFTKMPVIPITRQRAISQVNNPSADPEDVALIIAYSAGEMFGYIGCLPDTIGSEKKVKVAWLSCWWVHPSKGGNAGTLLFLKAYQAWDGHFMITDFTPAVRNVVKASRLFTFLLHQPGARLYLRFTLAEVLPRKIPFLHNFYTFLKISDILANTALSLHRAYWKRRYKNADFCFEYMSLPNQAAREFIRASNKNLTVARSAEEISWILTYPWVTEGIAEKDEQSRKYYFTVVADVFRQYFFKIKNNGRIIALVLLTNINGHIHIPYLFADKTKMPEVVSAIVYKAIAQKAKTLTTFQPAFLNYIKKNNKPFIYARSLKKERAVAKQINPEEITNDFWQDGEGDGVFT